MKYARSILAVMTLFTLLLASCGQRPADSAVLGGIAEDDDRICGAFYEIFAGSFYDSDGDGMGDLNGVSARMDYLNDQNPDSDASLNVDGIWLMPVMPSPSYHKYDVTDYYGIDSAYGTIGDFDRLAEECHKRGVLLIIDLVMNHTSNQHPWFQSAVEEVRSGAEWHYADYYNISPERTGDTRCQLDVPGWYYEASFTDHMPDLNFDNPEVWEEFKNIARYWLIDRHVDGFRLDALKFIYNDQQKNVDFLHRFTDYCRSVKPDVYIVGEVWSTDAEIMSFYESGINSLFNFTLSGRDGYIAKAANSGRGADFVNRLERWDKLLAARSPGAVDAIFLSNHDQDRSAGYFGGDLQKEKMAAALYLLAPGNPFIYYGEEIGLEGSGRDENKRGPMIWSVQDTSGLTDGPADMSQKYNAGSGASQQLADPDSLLMFYIRALQLRRSIPAISRGRISEISTGDDALAVYRSSYNGSEIIIAHNLSSGEKTLALEPGRPKTIGGFLCAAAGEPAVKGDTVILPGYSSTVIIV